MLLGPLYPVPTDSDQMFIINDNIINNNPVINRLLIEPQTQNGNLEEQFNMSDEIEMIADGMMLTKLG